MNEPKEGQISGATFWKVFTIQLMLAAGAVTFCGISLFVISPQMKERGRAADTNHAGQAKAYDAPIQYRGSAEPEQDLERLHRETEKNSKQIAQLSRIIVELRSFSKDQEENAVATKPTVGSSADSGQSSELLEKHLEKVEAKLDLLQLQSQQIQQAENLNSYRLVIRPPVTGDIAEGSASGWAKWRYDTNSTTPIFAADDLGFSYYSLQDPSYVRLPNHRVDARGPVANFRFSTGYPWSIAPEPEHPKKPNF